MSQHRAAPALAASAAVLTAAIIGGQAGPQQPRAGLWYASLRKPPFTPPGPVIGAAWTVLYGLLGFAGYRLIRAPASRPRTVAVVGWVATLGGIALFPYAFFRQRDLRASGAVVTGMLASSATAAGAALAVDRKAAAAIAPVVAWVTFAGLLNAELWRRN